MFSSNIASMPKLDKTSPEMERKDDKSQGTIMPTFKLYLLVMTGKLYFKISSNVVVLNKTCIIIKLVTWKNFKPLFGRKQAVSRVPLMKFTHAKVIPLG